MGIGALAKRFGPQCLAAFFVLIALEERGRVRTRIIITRSRLLVGFQTAPTFSTMRAVSTGHQTRYRHEGLGSS